MTASALEYEREHATVPFGSVTQQLTELIAESHTPLGASGQFTSSIFTTDGFQTVNILVLTNVSGNLHITERVTCDAPSPSVPVVDGIQVRNIATTFDPSTGRWFVSVVVPVTARAMQIRFLNGINPQAFFQLSAYLLPINGACCAPGGGTGDTGGPGQCNVTKTDIVVPAGLETPILTAADIPLGIKEVIIKNVGANTIRVGPPGQVGAAIGIPLLLGEAMAIGDYGSIAPLNGFSTLGTTVGFFFQEKACDPTPYGY